MSKDKKSSKKTKPARPYAEIYKDAEGEFHYRIFSVDGKVLVRSKGYANEADVNDGLFELVEAFLWFRKAAKKGDNSWLREPTTPIASKVKVPSLDPEDTSYGADTALA